MDKVTVEQAISDAEKLVEFLSKQGIKSARALAALDAAKGAYSATMAAEGMMIAMYNAVSKR